jgi:phenylalanyl-tRNA synthetase beta chain
MTVERAFREEEFLAIYLTGPYESENWINPSRPTQYHDLAQHVMHVMEKCGFKKIKQSPTTAAFMEYGMDLSHGNIQVGRLGKVKMKICRELGIKQAVFYGELLLKVLFQSVFHDIIVEETPKFPEVRRDLSLVIDSNLKFEDIQAIIDSAEKRLIREVVVFDVYTGDNIPKGKKAYALGFTLLDEQRTLTDEEIDKVMNKLINSFEQKLGAIIRK